VWINRVRNGKTGRPLQVMRAETVRVYEDALENNDEWANECCPRTM
jgi:hypothetical protein